MSRDVAWCIDCHRRCIKHPDGLCGNCRSRHARNTGDYTNHGDNLGLDPAAGDWVPDGRGILVWKEKVS